MPKKAQESADNSDQPITQGPPCYQQNVDGGQTLLVAKDHGSYTDKFDGCIPCMMSGKMLHLTNLIRKKITAN